jgi:CDP-glycerol glycerophosphotransferase (TagB/SpsB family)
LEKEIIRQGYSVKWFSDLEDGKKALKGKNNLLDSITDVIAYKPDIVLGATDDVPDFIKGLKVQIFHGFFAKKRPLKNGRFYHFRIRGFFDLYCTQGPNTTIEFTRLSKKLKHFEVIETGWSKVDPLFPLKEITDRKELPIIMIASTFSERLSLSYNEAVFNEIKRLTNLNLYKFIMVLHPKLPMHIVKKWKSLTNTNFKFYDTTDLTPLFVKADILFADTTSAIQEFVLQKKPIVTFNHRVHEDYLVNIEEAKDIENAFGKALNPSQDLLDKINNYINELHPYFDGQSSKRVINSTINFLHKDKSYLKSKPLNLVRKYKIRKRLGYFTLKSFNNAYTLELKNNNG